MIFLEAAIGADIALFALLILFIVVGVVFFKSKFMKFYRDITSNDNSIVIKQPYYKDLLPLFISVVISLIISIFLFFLFVLFLGLLFPNFDTIN